MPQHLIRFVVEGSGVFPFDMLRYDRAWPEHEFGERGSRKMEGDWEAGKRQITLITYGPVTPKRWESFGWKVISETPASVVEAVSSRKRPT